MYIGITLLFKSNNSKRIEGILKSTTINTNIELVLKDISSAGTNIANHYGYKFLGINDIFTVSGTTKSGEILGRTSFFGFDNIKKSKKLLLNPKNYSLNQNTVSKTFNCSLVYLCKNSDGEKYTISVLSVIESLMEAVIYEAERLGNDFIFKNKIQLLSIDDIVILDFIGIEDICDIDIKFNVFQTFYSDFNDTNSLEEELLSEVETIELINSVFDSVAK